MKFFNAALLPFDTESLLSRIKPLVECESPTWDRLAVNRAMDIAAYDLARIGARIERLAGIGGFGDILIARLPHPRPSIPGVLVLGHLDTVHPIGTIERLPWRIDGNSCYGPGIADMKSGICLAIDALEQLQRAGIEPFLPVTMMLTGDEEAGSPSSRALIEAEAARQKYVLVPEPARIDGSIVMGRHAISRFRLKTEGRAAHAGAIDAVKPASALREMAEKIIAIEQLSDEDATCSVGICHSGQWSNCIPAVCHAEALVVARTEAAMTRKRDQLLTLRALKATVDFTVEQGSTRPQWVANDRCRDLYLHARAVAATIGIDLNYTVAGGGSDGNFTGAMGIATLDGLGAVGHMYHTLQEHVLLDSLVERGRLLAGLLATLD